MREFVQESKEGNQRTGAGWETEEHVDVLPYFPSHSPRPVGHFAASQLSTGCAEERHAHHPHRVEGSCPQGMHPLASPNSEMISLVTG